jgi:hypothetical protein
MAAYAVTFDMLAGKNPQYGPQYGMATLMHIAEMGQEMPEIMTRHGAVEHIVRAMIKNVSDNKLVATGACTLSILGDIPESQGRELLNGALLPTLCDVSCPWEAVTCVLTCIRSIVNIDASYAGIHIIRAMHTHRNKADVQTQGCAALASLVRSDADALVLFQAGAHKTAIKTVQRHNKNEKLLEYAHMLLHNMSYNNKEIDAEINALMSASL